MRNKLLSYQEEERTELMCTACDKSILAGWHWQRAWVSEIKKCNFKTAEWLAEVVAGEREGNDFMDLL